jgi:hypothetical protein
MVKIGEKDEPFAPGERHFLKHIDVVHGADSMEEQSLAPRRF